MSANEAFLFQNKGAGDYGPFLLYGGVYQVSGQGFTSGSLTLYQAGPNGTTYLSVTDAFVADGGDTIYLPVGSFKFTVVGEANLSFQIVLVRLMR